MICPYRENSERVLSAKNLKLLMMYVVKALKFETSQGVLRGIESMNSLNHWLANTYPLWKYNRDIEIICENEISWLIFQILLFLKNPIFNINCQIASRLSSEKAIILNMEKERHLYRTYGIKYITVKLVYLVKLRKSFTLEI